MLKDNELDKHEDCTDNPIVVECEDGTVYYKSDFENDQSRYLALPGHLASMTKEERDGLWDKYLR